MSSLPPYNPNLAGRAVWLAPVTSAGELPLAPLRDRAWTAVAVDRAELVGPLRTLSGHLDIAVVATPEEVQAPESGPLLLVAGPELSERVLRGLMGIAAGRARFMLLAGSVSVVQLLPDRAVLVRLNAGRALDRPAKAG
jgi:hypothetical protein